MLYQGIIGGGSSPVEPEDLSPVLLWTNPSPNNVFAETSLTLDLSNYTTILVEYGSRTKNQPDCVISGWYCKVIDLPNTNRPNTNVIATDNSNTVSGRKIWYEPSTKALTIGANYGTNESNNQAIPFNIYGVKDYVVEPVSPLKTVTKTYSVPVGTSLADIGTTFDELREIVGIVSYKSTDSIFINYNDSSKPIGLSFEGNKFIGYAKRDVGITTNITITVTGYEA